MKRRNFLGLGALLGLAPVLPKLDVKLMDGAVESFTPLTPLTPTASIQETIDSLFTINVEGNITVYPKNGESRITGTGYIDKNSQLIYWETTVKDNYRHCEDTIIKIDCGISGKVISIVEENTPPPEVYIEGYTHPFISNPTYLKKKIIITCRKI
jgi:hypothetical protein